MSRAKLLIDEDVWTGLAAALRQAGFDAVSIDELGLKGLQDEEILAYAVAEERTIFTHNIQDFAPLAELCFRQNRAHAGLIVARQFEKGKLLHRTLALLEATSPSALANTLRFI